MLAEHHLCPLSLQFFVHDWSNYIMRHMKRQHNFEKYSMKLILLHSIVLTYQWYIGGQELYCLNFTTPESALPASQFQPQRRSRSPPRPSDMWSMRIWAYLWSNHWLEHQASSPLPLEHWLYPGIHIYKKSMRDIACMFGSQRLVSWDNHSLGLMSDRYHRKWRNIDWCGGCLRAY